MNHFIFHYLLSSLVNLQPVHRSVGNPYTEALATRTPKGFLGILGKIGENRLNPGKSRQIGRKIVDLARWQPVHRKGFWVFVRFLGILITF